MKKRKAIRANQYQQKASKLLGIKWSDPWWSTVEIVGRYVVFVFEKKKEKVRQKYKEMSQVTVWGGG